MRAFVVLGSKPRDWLGECLRNDLFCVEWDVNSVVTVSETDTET